MYTFCNDVLTTATSSLTVVKGNERFDNALLCIALEGIEQVAAYMGTDFQTELMDVLYGLVDFLALLTLQSGQLRSVPLSLWHASCEIRRQNPFS